MYRVGEAHKSVWRKENKTDSTNQRTLMPLYVRDDKSELAEACF